MKKSLRELAAENKKLKDADKSIEKSPSENEDAEELMKKYSGFTDNELLSELIRLTEEQKAEGSFDANAVKNGFEAIAPMLNDEQRQKLNELESILGKLI